MAATISDDTELIEALSTKEQAIVSRLVKRRPAFNRELQTYIQKFGDRCLDELKLESYTLFDNPLPLYRSIGSFAKRIRSNKAETEMDEAQISFKAERVVKQALAGKFLNRLVFQLVLKHARRLVRNRENLRFERTRLFGRIRRLFLEAGMRLASFGMLEDRRDIFYLEVDEVLKFVDGTGTTKNLKDLVRVRKNEYERFKGLPPPADRFATRGPVHLGNTYKSSDEATVVPQGNTMKGLGCCPGVVSGRVRIITDPATAALKRGEILVAERTDPGWIMLFPAAAGILVARGNPLSHSAIVAREMGIPAVVSLTGIIDWLNNGDYIYFDGSTGIVTKIACAKDEAHKE
jgi:pyruvate,water dikinase